VFRFDTERFSSSCFDDVGTSHARQLFSVLLLQVLAGRVCTQRLQARAPQRLCSTVVGSTKQSLTSTSAKAQRDTRLVGWWLTGTAGSVAVMICLGGYTRLTRSGLSMVDWRPQGRALPSSQAEWEAEFDKYKAFPEFQKVNRNIDLEEFKNIYFVEWFHRMWGRGIGLIFLVPAAYFAARGMIPARVRGKVAAAGTLGAVQGGVGWWMVKSGLTTNDKDERAKNSVPRVSPYRLATHLGVAFTTYSILTWAAMDLLSKPAAALSASNTRAVRALKPFALAATAVAGVTAASGAFVAGNDAGRAYNDWPLMAGKFIPEEIWDEKLGMKNVFENTATVQFDHRMLAYSTLATVGALTLAARRPSMWSSLPGRARSAVNAMGVTVLGQVGLGITTLMMYVPIGLGTAHQGGALLLWTTALWLMHGLRRHATNTGAAKVSSATAAAARAAAGVPLLLAAPAAASAAAQTPASHTESKRGETHRHAICQQ